MSPATVGSRSLQTGQWQPILTRVSEPVTQLGDRDRSAGLGSSRYVDVSLSCRPGDVTCLAFQNNYTASLKLEQRPRPLTSPLSPRGSRHPPSKEEPLIVLPKLVLMQEPDCEDDAQACLAIYQSQLAIPLRVVPPLAEPTQVDLRIHLQQPSTRWPVFGLQNVKAFKFVPCASPADLQDTVPSAMSLIREADERLRQLQVLAAKRAAAGRPPDTTVTEVRLQTSAANT
ncbi:unnamed protein product [Polarella glacialis]|uniref:Uncharacterized protein n=1 Tax=Polarella glacialis TaxID=89957 RepID=A0A813KID8_POLGL|nr:unnamed protein product [Polarella glacialis]